jgi:uncharacterized protein YndB with AHSA1/START domain
MLWARIWKNAGKHDSADKPMSEPALQLRRIYSASREEIFAAWTDPEQMCEWLCPAGATISLIEVDLRVGGAFRIDMQSEQGTFAHTGIYQEIIPPERLVFTWSSINTQHRETLVTVELIQHGQQTELVLTHEGLPDQNTKEMHAMGWRSILDKLAFQVDAQDS